MKKLIITLLLISTVVIAKEKSEVKVITNCIPVALRNDKSLFVMNKEVCELRINDIRQCALAKYDAWVKLDCSFYDEVKKEYNK